MRLKQIPSQSDLGRKGLPLPSHLLSHSHRFWALSMHCRCTLHVFISIFNSILLKFKFILLVYIRCTRISLDLVPKRFPADAKAIRIGFIFFKIYSICHRCWASSRNINLAPAFECVRNAWQNNVSFNLCSQRWTSDRWKEAKNFCWKTLRVERNKCGRTSACLSKLTMNILFANYFCRI